MKVSKVIEKDGQKYNLTLEVTKLNEGFIKDIKYSIENKKELVLLAKKLNSIISPIQSKICSKYGIGKLIGDLSDFPYSSKQTHPKKDDFGNLYSIIEDPFDDYDEAEFKDISNKYHKAAEELEAKLNQNEEFKKIATIKDLSILSDQIYCVINVKKALKS